MPDLSDPRGVKYPFQGTRCYYATGRNPALPGSWNLAAELQFEMLHGTDGATPSVCILRELPAGTTAKCPATVNSETAKTGNDENGTLFCGLHVSVDSLVKVEAQPIGSSTWKPIFLGVVVKPQLDLDSMTILWHCEDYRHFMRKRELYGRTVYDPDNSEYPVYIKGSRMTFNEGGQPDRGQVGATLSEDGADLACWVPADYNRADDLTTSGPALAEHAWADYWLAGHIWNYWRAVYFLATPTDIAYLSLGDYINMPEASEDSEGDLYWLFNDATLGRVICSDWAVTGASLDKGITGLLQKAGPYSWTLVPNEDGYTCDIVPFHIHEGLGDPLDFNWGDYKQSVYSGAPEITGGKLFRDREEFYNRGFAISRKTVVETSLTNRANFHAGSTPAQLVMDALDADVTAWLAARDSGSADVALYPNVYRRFRVPNGYDWGAYVFNGSETKAGVGSFRGALSSLITRGWAFEATADPVPVFRPMKPQVWRNKNVGGTPSWEALPSNIGVEVLYDACGITLSDNARTGDDPWIWNGDTSSPVIYDLLVTLAIEADELMTSSVDNTSTGDCAREYFMDGGNAYRPCERINAYFPVDGSGNITTNNPTGAPVKFGTPAAPSLYVDRAAALSSELKYRMQQKNAVVITGSIPLWGMRFDPWPVGYLFGTMLVAGDEPTRPELNLNACIRSFRMTRNPPATALVLDGR